MTVYGYARLVGYDETLKLEADVLESYETVEDRIFTAENAAEHIDEAF